MFTAGFNQVNTVLGANLTTNETAILLVVLPALFSFITVVYTRRTRKELKPNGGSSFRDAIDQMRAEQKLRDEQFDKRFTAIEDYITNPPKGHPYS